MNALLRRLMRTGFRRGVQQGSRGWLLAGIVAGGIRALQRLAHDEPEILYRTEIKPGDRFDITARPPVERS